MNLGATHVLTYDELADKSLRQKVKEWTGGKVRNLFFSSIRNDLHFLSRIFDWALTV